MTPDPASIHAGDICSIEASIFGYESSIVRFPIRSATGMVNIGVLTVQRNTNPNPAERSSLTVSATSLQAPPGAVRLFDRGVRLLADKKFPDAAKNFEAAIKIYANYAESWLNLVAHE